MKKTDAAIFATGAVVVAAMLGARYRPTPDEPRNMLWYASLNKPGYRPSGKTIGMAWMALDTTLAFAGTRLMSAPPSKARATALTGWLGAVSGIAIYPFLMFGRYRLGAALASVVGMMAATLTAVGAGASVDKKAAGAMLPLVAWLGFAGLLQEEIWRTNR